MLRLWLSLYLCGVGPGSDEGLRSYRVGQVDQVLVRGGRVLVVCGQLPVVLLELFAYVALRGRQPTACPSAFAAWVQRVELPFVQFGTQPQRLVLGEPQLGGARRLFAGAPQLVEAGVHLRGSGSGR